MLNYFAIWNVPSLKDNDPPLNNNGVPDSYSELNGHMLEVFEHIHGGYKIKFVDPKIQQKFLNKKIEIYGSNVTEDELAVGEHCFKKLDAIDLIKIRLQPKIK